MSRQSRFLLDTPLTGPGQYALPPMEAHHAANVLRLRPGDAMVVFDGAGNYADAEVVAVGKDGVRVAVTEVMSEPHLPLELTIATAIPKGKRWQALVEKCTELGVDRIVPMRTEHGVAKGEGDPEKWRRWVVEAAKQCRRSRLPEVCEPIDLAEVLSDARRDGSLVFFADPAGEGAVAYREAIVGAKRVVALVGPEGGFSEAEVAACRLAGAHPLRVSSFILRIETAAAAVCLLIREVF